MTALQTLVDERDIKALATRYANSLDRQDWPAFRTCFAPSVTVDTAGLRGEAASTMTADAWVTRVRGSAELFDDTLHYLSNQEVEIDGDEALCRSYVYAEHWKAGSEDGHFTVHGIYTHGMRRTEAGWRITSVALSFKHKQGQIGARKTIVAE